MQSRTKNSTCLTTEFNFLASDTDLHFNGHLHRDYSICDSLPRPTIPLRQDSISRPAARICTSMGVRIKMLQYEISYSNQRFLYYRIKCPDLRQRSVLHWAFASRFFNIEALTETTNFFTTEPIFAGLRRGSVLQRAFATRFFNM